MRALVIRCLFAIALPLAVLSAQRPSSAATAIPSRIQRRFPCPAAIPASWGVADSTLAHAPRCALVAAAVHAVNASVARNPRLRNVSLARVGCIKIQRMTFRNPGNERVVSDQWLVDFYSDGQPDLTVSIDPTSGDGRAFISKREFDYSTRQLCAQLPNNR